MALEREAEARPVEAARIYRREDRTVCGSVKWSACSLSIGVQIERRLTSYARSSGPVIASCLVAPLCIDALLRAAAAGIGKLRKLILQRMPTGFDSRHVVDELPNLAREGVICCRSRAL